VRAGAPEAPIEGKHRASEQVVGIPARHRVVKYTPSRIEPDGDAGKKMAWNLLLGHHERRMGYVWVEFGCIGEGGEMRYLTLGCGLFAVAARAQVDHWFFLREGRRAGQDFWLMSPARVVLTPETATRPSAKAQRSESVCIILRHLRFPRHPP
jgi:hypothetical protein